MGRGIAAAALVGAALLATAGTVAAVEVVVTLQVDYPLLQAAFGRHLGLGGPPHALWGSLDGCQALMLHDLRLGPSDDRVQITAAGVGRVGFEVGSFCLFPLSWTGFLDVDGRPAIDRDWQLRLVDRRSRLLDESRRNTWVARRLWSFLGPEVDEVLAGFRFDLAPPAEEIRALLRVSVPPARAAPVLDALRTLRPLGASAGPDAVAIRVGMDVRGEPTSGGSAPEPALTEAERAAWTRRLDDWDAFVVFVVKDLGGLDDRRAVRDALFDLLMRSRHRLLEILGAGPQPGEDPARRLFLDTWGELRDVVRRAAIAGEIGEHALRYVAFLAAGDALAALDAAAPGLGLEVSADGLRRLARVLAPELTTDPLATSDAPDPQLRELFGFHDPEGSPPGTAEPGSAEEPPDGGTPESQTSPGGPPADTPPSDPDPHAAGAPRPASLVARLSAWWPLSGAAWAAEAPPANLDAIGRALDRWVPPDTELRRYRDLVSSLLDLVVAHEHERSTLAARFAALYRHLVRATAWQESCWRQFVLRNGRVAPLRSPTGDVGLMQVNVRVWRGFFDVQKLAWDIVYNAGSGAEILARLLERYGEREAARRDGHPARACYAAYNGGPAAFDRYRGRASPTDRAVDEMFWEKFRVTEAGQELDQVLCQPL